MRPYFEILRVKQWIKNFFVLVPLVYSKHLFDEAYLTEGVLAFVAFSFVSSVVYIINDIFDADSDRNHPVKKLRPVAAGKISKNNAWIYAFFVLVPVFISAALLNTEFRLILAAYLVINFLYSVKLKHVVLIDLFIIAAGFMLRVIGGGLAINVEISSWLILTTMFVSLFLAVMKRRSELDNHGTKVGTRRVLESYSYSYIDQISSVAAGSVIVCYALYTTSERTISVFNTEYLVYTTPFVVFGIFRFMFLVHINQKGENTSEVIGKDIPSLMNILFYILTVLLIIYL
ncbi:MAG: decaprenyl-phosphate phosphoribosyltransferase [Ignavibacteriaceae bacterium]|nr:decaprenyl-phosphate phosphoribosyltransferase [Ignavibacteriaceae bacterium]